jgi:hypothetical protein
MDADIINSLALIGKIVGSCAIAWVGLVRWVLS